jgi:hypothetical protein
VLAADQTPGNNETTVNGGTSPTDGGFTPGWDQEAEQRVQARRTRVQAVAATENPARPPTTQAHQNIDEVDEDDEERKLHLLGFSICCCNYFCSLFMQVESSWVLAILSSTAYL